MLSIIDYLHPFSFSSENNEDEQEQETEIEEDPEQSSPPKKRRFFVRRAGFPKSKKFHGIPHRTANKNIEIRVELAPEDLEKLIRPK